MKGKRVVFRKAGNYSDEESRKVLATIFGDLAIYKDGHGYSIGHVKTGFRVANADSRSQAQQIVYRLNNEGLDWNFSDPNKVPKETSQKGKQIIQEVCDRQVPVFEALVITKESDLASLSPTKQQ